MRGACARIGLPAMSVVVVQAAEPSSGRFVDASGEPIPAAVERDHERVFEATRVVGARGVARVVIHERALELGKDGRRRRRALEQMVRELAEALRVDVLELAVQRVPDCELELAREASRERQPPVHELRGARARPERQRPG